MKHAFSIAIVAMFLIVGLSTMVERASATPGATLGTQMLLSQVATAAASYTPAFKVTCATTPTAITNDAGPLYEAACFTRATASVYLGAATVTAAANGFCVSTTDAQCAGKGFVMEVTNAITHCVVASGTEDLLCMRTK